MRTQISRWGNSVGVRIPKVLARRLGLAAGSEVEIEEKDGRIVLRPVAPRYRMEELLAGMTPEAMHDAFEWGDDLGRERVV